MIRHAIRVAIQTSRRPNPRRTVEAELLPRRSPAVALAIGKTLESTLTLMKLDFGPQVLLIPDGRAGGEPGPRFAHIIASRLAPVSAVSLGLPDGLSPKALRRWRSLAASAGASVTILGTTGWDRIEFGDRSLILEDGDFPAELCAATSVVALSRPSNEGSIALWTSVVHPNTALRARVADNASVELSMAVDAQYVVCGQVGSRWLVAAATPAIVAELVARGLERMRERPAGIESTAPWENDGIQHLSSLGEARAEVVNLVVDTWLEDNAGMEVARRLAEMLGWQLKLMDSDLRGATA